METKVYSLSEVSQHNNPKDCWLIISGKVYDVTKFLDEHPGGDEILLNATGKDATEDFEDVGHSTSAKATMAEYCVGDVDASTIPKKVRPPPRAYGDAHTGNTRAPESTITGITVLRFLVPLVVLGLALGIGLFYSKSY